MTTKIDICDITLGQMNAAVLVRVNKFARVLERTTGQTITLSNDRLIGDIVKVAKTTDDYDLQRLYKAIKEEIRKHINSPKFEIKTEPNGFIELQTFAIMHESPQTDELHES